MKIHIQKYPLYFKRPAGTSRGVLKTKNTWFVRVFEENNPQEFGLGEINMFEGLSDDDRPEFYEKLIEVQENPELYLNDFHAKLIDFPAIRFGLETAVLDFQKTRNRILFPSNFTKGEDGIPINGLIWMGEEAFMKEQIKAKIESGFRCLKMKIGAINFDNELAILKSIRKEYSKEDLELRVDANGAFASEEAIRKLDQLSKLQLHSIEQPIRQGQLEAMRKLCVQTPLAIALDEELIGVNDLMKKKDLLSFIKPQYIILKPALTGGFQASKEWIDIAEKLDIAWWITSALESNIGLNAIAQWTYSLNTNNYQGLGTGQLFTNNISSPLQITGERLFYRPELDWAKVNWQE